MIKSIKKIVILYIFLNFFFLGFSENLTITSSTYFGGTSSEDIRKIAIDNDGNIYAIFYTGSSDLPTSTSAFDNSYNDNGDVYIAKFDPALKYLLAATYLGGNKQDIPTSILIDKFGRIVICGYTNSTNFPTTDGTYQQFLNGSSNNGFICIFDHELSTLISSTYFGGANGVNFAKALTQDNESNFYVVGRTDASDFPTTENAFDRNFGGSTEGFIIKFDNSLSNVLASTFIGGDGTDELQQIIYTNNEIIVAGFTTKSLSDLGIPDNLNGYDQINENGYTPLIVKFNTALNSVTGATLFGGDGAGFVDSLNVDSENNVYIAGKTVATNLPTSSNSFDPTFNGDWDCYIAKFNNSLTSLLNCTYLGGATSEEEEIHLIVWNNKLFAFGRTESSDFPLTDDAERKSHFGNGEGFISIFDLNLSQMEYSSFIGGEEYEGVTCISNYQDQYLIAGGYTNSNNFQEITDGYCQTLNGGNDGFLIKFSIPTYSYIIPHIAEQNWITAIDVYNPTNTQIEFSISKWNNGELKFENKIFSVEPYNHIFFLSSHIIIFC